MAAALTPSRWPDLLPELLGLVLSRVPSHADRVRFRAVCRPWRSGARPLPPLLPWAALPDGTFLSLPDGAAHRMPVPDDVDHCVSTGSMLFLVHRDGRFSLMHPQSGDTTPQQMKPYYVWPFPGWPRGVLGRYRVVHKICKVVVSDHIVAARTYSRPCTIDVSIHARGGAGMKWWVPHKHDVQASDIALFQGKLYILTWSEDYELHVLDVTGVIDEQGGGGVRSVQCVSAKPMPTDFRYSSFWYRRYLVASGDRLLMVQQMTDRVSWFHDRTLMTSRFEVFEAADLNSGHGRWSKVDTLMGCALFVSEGCSESLPTGSVVGAREDCIYFMSAIWFCSGEKVLESGVYNMKQGTTVRPLPPLETLPATLRDGPWSPTWLFPVET